MTVRRRAVLAAALAPLLAACARGQGASPSGGAGAADGGAATVRADGSREWRFNAATDAGMFLLWSPEAFAELRGDQEAWDAELSEDADILRHVASGDCVPVNIGSDLASGFVVRVGDTAPLSLTDRERTYLIVSSEPYLFVSKGSGRLDGIENVGSGQGPVIDVPAGRWSVTVHLIAWDDEPGALGADGRPVPDALPDFVLLLDHASGTPTFRQKLGTFDDRHA